MAERIARQAELENSPKGDGHYAVGANGNIITRENARDITGMMGAMATADPAELAKSRVGIEPGIPQNLAQAVAVMEAAAIGQATERATVESSPARQH